MVSSLYQPYISPEEFSLSQPPLFAEDRVEDIILPQRPSTVCDACWEGLFAKHLGLPCVSPPGGEFYVPQPKTISYSVSLAGVRLRAYAGCIWCQILLPRVRDLVDKNPDTRANISVRGFVDTGRYSNQHYQGLQVVINEAMYFDWFVYTASDDPAASCIITRNPILDVGSPFSLALAREHIDKCVYEHEACQSLASTITRLPTRLVDCIDLARPRLIPTIGKEYGEYLALSYVWGEEQHHKTTKANISTYEQGISPALIPSTIRDAIHVTHMLGFRWLWVDSLCIVQDSDEDKLHEIGRMHHIYRYAHLTIIAASAKTVSEGFLHRRHPSYDEITLPFVCLPCTPAAAREDPDGNSAEGPRVGQVHLASLDSMDNTYDRDLGLMRTRAWCMQEYLMSPRSLIFTPSTLQLRCLTTVQNVGHSFCPQTCELRIPSMLFRRVPPALKPGSQGWKDIHMAWINVVEDYSRRTASVESDKLVACAAIAEQFHRILRSDYLAGMWRSRMLLTDLLWVAQLAHPAYGPRHTRPTEYRAPSWSWAAIDGKVYRSRYTPYFEHYRTFALAEIVECRVTLEDDQLPFGRVTSGTILLRGTLLPCHCGVRYSNESYQCTLPSLSETRRRQLGIYGQPEDGGDGLDSKNPELRRAGITMDCQDDETGQGRMWVVPFIWVPGQDGEQDSVIGIGVVELAAPTNSSGTSNGKTRFQRVGVFCATAGASKRPKDVEHPLWDPLIRDMKCGQWPLVDIEIV